PATASPTAAEHASDALARAQALFSEKSPAAARRQAASRADATMVLNQLVRAMDDLSPADQKRARSLLARPSDPGGENVIGQIAYSTGEATPECGATICVHYANPGDGDAPPDVDTNPDNGIPDEVDRALATAEHVNATYVDAGYRRPDPDGSIGGGVDKVDVYLADTGKFVGVYGYCTTDQPGTGAPWNRWAYCVIDDDFREGQFPSHTPVENQRVTLAHEYFHAVQFAYDFAEDGWIMEATATWAEEQLYDGINDNRQYIRNSQIRKPWIPLDEFGVSHYGNWVFFQYLTERWRGETGSMPTLMLDLWKRMDGSAGRPDQYSTQAIQYVLNKRNTSFTSVYGKFADANRRPQKSYSEGSAGAYRPMRPAKTWTLSASKRSIGPGWVATVNHLTSLPLRFKPARGLTQRDWKLRLRADLPAASTAPVARVAAYLKSGKVTSSTIRFKRRGFSSKVVGFSARNVKYVELVLVNASRRSRCWTDQFSPFACLGTPLDDGRRTKFGASIFRS
ncbi:MAG: MXAN_6640 family putative metalloprotease, partial [Nocardioides sp.]